MMGVTRVAVIGQLKRMRQREVEQSPLLKDLSHHVQRLRTLGLSPAQIAQALGVPMNTIRGYLWQGSG